jgi:hypothetical protein
MIYIRKGFRKNTTRSVILSAGISCKITRISVIFVQFSAKYPLFGIEIPHMIS